MALPSVTLPSGVTSIGASAFSGCNKLTSINIPSGVTSIGATAFSGCSVLNSINIPSGVTIINNNTFTNCLALPSVTLPTSVTIIGTSAFSGCTALTDVTLLRKSPQTLTTLSSSCFLNTGMNLTNYGSVLEMFNNGYSQAQLTTTAGILGTVFTRVSTVFNFLKLSVSKTNITSYNSSFNVDGIPLFIPSSVTSISPNVFQNMPYTSFTSLNFIGSGNSGITTIGSGAFRNSYNIINASFPSSLISIGESAFQNCAYFTNLVLKRTLAQGLTTLGSKCFLDSGLAYTWSGIYYLGYKRAQLITAGLPIETINATNPPLGIEIIVDVNNVLISASYDSGSTELVIPNTVTSIADNAFLNSTVLTKITSVIIPSSVTSIGNTAFQGCTNLTSVTLQRTSAQGLTILGTDCFSRIGITTTNYVSVTNMYSMGYTSAQLTTAGISTALLNKAVGDVFFVFDNDSTKTSITGFNSAVSITGLTPEIPSSVTSIGPNAFSGLTTLTNITFLRTSDQGLTNLSTNCFLDVGFTTTNYLAVLNMRTIGYSIGELNAAGIDVSITDIVNKNSNFLILSADKTIITSYDPTIIITDMTIFIPSSITSIDANAFINCPTLSQIIIPRTVISIGSTAFQGCSALTSVTLERTFAQGLITLGTDCFLGVGFTVTNFTSVSNMYIMGYTTAQLTTSGISTALLNKAVGDVFFVFDNDATKTSITGFNSAVSVTGLNPEIPNTVTSIGANAFLNCATLNQIIIPSIVISIGATAFSGCTSLTSVTLLRISPLVLTTLGTGCFLTTGITETNCESIENMYMIGYTRNNLITAGISTTVIDRAISNVFFIFSEDKTTIIGYNSAIIISGINITFPTSVTIIGDNAFLNCSTLTNITISSNVTSIGISAFQGCTTLTSITFPSSITVISISAFQGCTALTSITFPSSITLIGNSAFQGCTALTSTTFPSSITLIGNSAFQGCTALTSTTFPSSITLIGNSAFQGCTALSSVTLQRISPLVLTILGTDCFSSLGFTTTNFTSVTNMYTIGYTTDQLTTSGISTTILNKAVVNFFFVFNNVSTKTSINTFNSAVSVNGLDPEIPSSVTSIGPNAFLNCTTLTNITISINIISIGINAFQGCVALSKISIPNTTITTIGSDMFSGCTNLTLVTLTNNVTSISNNAFLNCSKLQNIIFPTNLSSIGTNAFKNCINLKLITLPNSLANIGANAFQGCSTLTPLIFPSTLTSIGASAFQDCSSLTSVTFQRISPLVLTTLGSSCFLNAGFTDINFSSITDMYTIGYTTANLITSGISTTVLNKAVVNAFFVFSDSNKTSITGFNSAFSFTGLTPEIPSSVTSIGPNAFLNCSTLTNITFKRTSDQGLTSLGSNCFSGIGITTTNFTSVTNMCIMGYTPDNLITSGISTTILNKAVVNAFFVFNNSTTKTSITGFNSTVSVTGLNPEIPTSVTSIDANAFLNCISLNQIIVPSTVTTIGVSVFQNCTNLTSVTLQRISSQGLTTLGTDCFLNVGFIVTNYQSLLNIYKMGYTKNDLITSGISVDIIDNVVSNDFLILSGDKLSITGFKPSINISNINIIFPSTVSSIGNNAFINCTTLTNITIPISVTSIGTSAFQGCNKLSTISIPNSITNINDNTFNSCTMLTSVIISSSVTNIGTNAFLTCNALRVIIIPSSVTSIGATAFKGCSVLTSVILERISPQSLTILGTNCFNGMGFTVTNYESVTNMFKMGYTRSNLITSGISENIVNNATIDLFLILSEDKTIVTGYNSAIEVSSSGYDIIVTFPSSVTMISASAFLNCPTLKFITIPTSVTSIGANAFKGCAKLSTITIPNSVTNISDNTFQNCPMLTSLIISSSVTSIGTSAFQDCIRLYNVTIPNNVTSIGASAFQGCIALSYIILQRTSVQGLTILNTNCFLNSGFSDVTYQYISNMFTMGYTRNNLITAGIPTNLINLGGSNAFFILSADKKTVTGYNTIDITDITISIPTSVTSILSSTFLNLTTLKNITISSNVTSIGSNAFQGCSNLTIIILQRVSSQTLTILDTDCFLNTGFTLTNYQYISNMYNMGYTKNNLITAGILTDIIDKAILNAFFILSEDQTIVTGYNSSINISGINMVIPPSVTSIASGAFYNCKTLTEITIPPSVISMSGGVFSDCTALINVTIEGLPTIDTTNMFFNCSKLTSFNIPLNVTSINNGMFFNCSSLTSVNIPNNVTSIGIDAFYNCRLLQDINIPNSVTSIGKRAFSGCTALTNVTIPDGVTSIDQQVFHECILLQNVSLPNSITSIGNDAFFNCCLLQDINIPNSVTSIGNQVFQSCWALTSISMPNSITMIGESVFTDCRTLQNVTISNRLTSIKYGTFFNCPLLQNINIPNSVTSIDINSFFQCSSLTNISIPDSVVSIGNGAFQDCWQLTNITIQGFPTLGTDCFLNIGFSELNYKSVMSMYSISYTRDDLITSGISPDIVDIAINEVNAILQTFLIFNDDTKTSIVGFNSEINISGINIFFPSSVTSIDANAFLSCVSLTKITIPSSVTSIGANAFQGCTNLTKAEIPSSVTSIGANAFQNCGFITFIWPATLPNINNYTFAGCVALTTVSISSGVTNIGSNVFQGCTALTAADIPASVTSIGANAFQNCGFITFIWPATLPNINNYIFQGCVALTSVTISFGVTNIGSFVFQGCTTLTIADIPSSVTFIGNNTFERCGFIIFTWPNTVTTINDYMFADCIYLQTVKIIPTVPKTNFTLGKYVFKDCISLKF